MGELLAELEGGLGRGRGWFAGAVLLFLVVAVGVYLWPAPPPDPCARAGEGIASAWSIERQVAVQIAFARSGVPYAEAGWRSTRQRLDDYTRRWRTDARAVCHATYVVHDESEPQFERSMTCLRRARSQVATLVSELAAGATDAVEHAVNAAESLPDLRACSDPGTLVLDVVPPAPRIAPVVELVREQLALALTEERIGRTEQSLMIALEARATTEALKYPPVHAEALTQIARALDHRQTADARKEAEGLYFEALDIAEGERLDPLAAMIWSRLVQLAVQMDSGTQQAYERWRRNAAAVHRIGDSAFDQARLHHMRGEIYYRDGRYGDAVVEENRAIATIAGAPEQQLELSRYYDALAKSLERAGNGAGNVGDALDLHERALGIASKALGAAHPDVVKLRMNYGIALKKQGRFAQASAELEAALDSIPATQRASYLDAGIIHGYLSEVSYEEGKLDSAAAHGRESVAIFERGGAPDRRRAEAYADLANTELKRKRFAEALALYERALGLRKDLAGDHYQLGVNQGSIAEALVGLSRYDEAMVHLREAERIFARGSAQDRATQAWILTVRGEVLVGQHQLGEAAGVLEHVLPMCEAVPDRSNQAYATWTLARALHGLGRSPERVRQLAEQARALFAGLGRHEAPDVDAVDQLIHQLSPVPVSPSRASRP